MRSSDNSGLKRQFRTGLTQRFVSDFFFRSVHFKNNPSRKNIKTISLRVSLSFSHAHFCGLGGKRTVRKNANPVFSTFGQGADSIWVDFTRACVSDFSPKEPKESFVPRVSAPLVFELLRPVCHFLNFTFLGINIKIF